MRYRELEDSMEARIKEVAGQSRVEESAVSWRDRKWEGEKEREKRESVQLTVRHDYRKDCVGTGIKCFIPTKTLGH